MTMRFAYPVNLADPVILSMFFARRRCVIELDKNLTPPDLAAEARAVLGAVGRVHRGDRGELPARLGVARVHRRTAATRRKGWTEWTQGFQYGSALLQFDATGDERFLELGRERTVARDGAASHARRRPRPRLQQRQHVRQPLAADERRPRSTPTTVGAAVLRARAQSERRRAGRALGEDRATAPGYIYSFNGPQSLFVDTIRSCRALALAHQLGHVLMGERDERISLLQRLVEHATTRPATTSGTAKSRDAYDVAGRTAHESVFNTNNGDYRCPSTQQGYSPFSTWTRGLAWAMLGFAEQLEWLATRGDDELDRIGGRDADRSDVPESGPRDLRLLHPRNADLRRALLGHRRARPREARRLSRPAGRSVQRPRAGRQLGRRDRRARPAAARALPRPRAAAKPKRASATSKPASPSSTRCSTSRTCRPTSQHEGLILHSVYHRPNGWDYIPPGRKVPCGESSMWGDYHAREVALYVERLAENAPYYTFFGPTRQ